MPDLLYIFDYYGLLFGLNKNNSEPILIYVTRELSKAEVKLNIEDGLFHGIDIRPVTEFIMLDKKDLEMTRLFIENYISEIIRIWTDYFVFHKSIHLEVIQKKIEKPLI